MIVACMRRLFTSNEIRYRLKHLVTEKGEVLSAGTTDITRRFSPKKKMLSMSIVIEIRDLKLRTSKKN